MTRTCTYLRCEAALERYNTSGLCGACAFHVRKQNDSVQDLWVYYVDDYNFLRGRSIVRQGLLDDFLHKAMKLMSNRYTHTYVGNTNDIADLAYPLERAATKASLKRLEEQGRVILVSTNPKQWMVNDASQET